MRVQKESTRLHIENARTGQFIGLLAVADNFLSRAKGLLGTDNIPYFQGLMIKPCKQVHTIGMRYPISVWFMDKNDTIIKIIDRLPPYRLSPHMAEALYVLEFPAGWAEKSSSEEGDRLLFSSSQLTTSQGQ